MNLLETLWNSAFTGSLRASALILCVFLLRIALRGRVPAQCFHVLWVLVAVRLLAPAPASSWSVFNLLQTPRRETALATDAHWRVRTGEGSAPAAGARPAMAAPAPTRAAPSLVPALWLAGALGHALLFAGAAWRMRRRLRDAQPMEDARVLSVTAECAEQLRLRRPPRVFETAALPGPAVLGLWRPRLLLPCGLTARLSDEELRFVLLHECAHLRRHDLAALWLLAAARVVHWFNPLVWLAACVARSDAELSCDETVLRVTSARSSLAYGAALLRLAQVATWHSSVLPAAGIVDSRRALRARVASIGRYAPGTRAQSWLAVLLVLAVTLSFGADEKIADTPAEPGHPVQLAAEPTLPAIPTEEDQRPKQPRRNDVQIEIQSRFIEVNATLARRLKLNTADVQVRDRAELSRLVEAISGRGSDVNVLKAQQQPDLLKIINGIGGGTDVFSAPGVTAHSGQRAVIEIIREFRYPTEWEPGTVVDGVKGPTTPKAFETRNCGITLEVEPTRNEDGTVALKLTPQVVEFLGFLDLETGKGHPVRRKAVSLSNRTVGESNPTSATGAPGHALKSIFSTRKLETEITLASGDAVLLTGAREAEETTPFASPERARRLLIIVSANVINLREGNVRVESSVAPGADSPPASVGADPAPSRGVPVSGKPGFVRSPYALDQGHIDVRGFPPGTEVKCPYVGKIFLVP